MKNWEAAIEDASICVAKDPSFIKGYYRLATAYTEIGNYDDALNVLQTALTKEPGEPVAPSSSSSLGPSLPQTMINYKNSFVSFAPRERQPRNRRLVQ
jgi:tetratricopeptide (TPR) repeat protein